MLNRCSLGQSFIRPQRYNLLIMILNIVVQFWSNWKTYTQLIVLIQDMMQKKKKKNIYNIYFNKQNISNNSTKDIVNKSLR